MTEKRLANHATREHGEFFPASKPSLGRPDPLAPASSGMLDPVLDSALHQAPTVLIPIDFAARVAAAAVAQPPRHALLQNASWRPFQAGYGPGMAVLCAVLLAVSLFAFAPGSAPSFANLRFDFELLLLAELGLVGFVLSRAALGR